MAEEFYAVPNVGPVIEKSGGGTFANDADLASYLLRRMGKGVVQVEITNEQLADAIQDAKRWFVANWGIHRARTFQMIQGVTEYTLSTDVAEVLDVQVEAVRLPPLVFDREFPFYFPFPMRAEGGVVFSYPAGLYSALVQQLQWIDQLKRIFGADLEFDYNESTRVLRIMTPGNQSGLCLIEYISNCVDVKDLFGIAEELFVDWARAELLERVGRARSKYGGIPTAGGERTLDGERLLEESKALKEELRTRAIERGYPIHFIRG